MPRPSKNQHVLATLRQTLGLGQKELADWVRCSRPAIQLIELGERTLTEKMARKVSQATGVAVDWLLALDYHTPPVTVDGQPLTREITDWHRAWRSISGATDAEMKHFREATKGLTVGLASGALLSPAMKERKGRELRRELDEQRWTLELSNPAGKSVPIPKGVNAEAVAKRLNQDIRRLSERALGKERAMALVERCWRVGRAAVGHEDWRLILFALEEGLQKIGQRYELPVRPLTASELRFLSEYFARRTETAWEVVKPGKSKPLRTDKRAKRR